MTVEFQNFSLTGIGEIIQPEKFGWVRLMFNFTDPQTNAHPSIEISVPIRYDRKQTIDDVHHAAFDKAKAVLAILTKTIAAHDLAELRQLNDEREAAQAKQLSDFLDPPSV